MNLRENNEADEEKGPICSNVEDIGIDVQFPFGPTENNCQFFFRRGFFHHGQPCYFNYSPHRLVNYLGYSPRPFQVMGDRSGIVSSEECKFYWTSGGCRNGNACKFSHSREKIIVGQSAPSFNRFPVQQAQVPVASSSRIGGSQYASSEALLGSSDASASVPVMPPTQAHLVNRGCEDKPEHSSSPDPQLVDSGNPIRRKSKTTSAVAQPNHPSVQFHLPKLTIPVNSVGLPLRPDRPVCNCYQQFGLCKYGITCQYDHNPLVVCRYTHASRRSSSHSSSTPGSRSKKGKKKSLQLHTVSGASQGPTA